MTFDLVHRNASARSLGLVRAWVFGIWAIALAFDPLSDLAMLPASSFSSSGLLRLVPDSAWHALLTAGALASVKWITIAFCFAAALGLKARPAAVLASIGLVLIQGLVRGFGHVNHGELALLYAAILLPLFPCADAFALRPETPRAENAPRYGIALAVLTAMLAFTYAFTGMNRVADGGFEIFSNGSLLRWVLEDSFLDPRPWSATVRAWAISPALKTFLAFALAPITLLEIAAPLALVSPRFRRFFVVAMLGFHAGVYVLMNILFWQNVLLFVLFLEWMPARNKETASDFSEAVGRRGGI